MNTALKHTNLLIDTTDQTERNGVMFRRLVLAHVCGNENVSTDGYVCLWCQLYRDELVYFKYVVLVDNF